MSSIQEDTRGYDGLIELLLESITDIIESLVSIKSESECYLQFSSYFYRVSVVLMEIQTVESVALDSADILESLSECIDGAKNLIEKAQENRAAATETDLGSIEEEIKGVVRQMGKHLESMQESEAFEEQVYAGLVVQSLAGEMHGVSFGDSETDDIQQNRKQMAVEDEIETDLYPTDPDVSYEIYLLSSESERSSQRNHGKLTESLSMLPEVTQFMEPPYQAFICPLSKELMEDPVTIETGITCERTAVTEWFERFGNPDEIYCPITGQKTKPILSTNIPLRTIIEEWKRRNDAARIKMAHAALSLHGSETMAIDALRDLQMICEGKHYNRVRVHEAGILELLDGLLAYRDKDLRYEVLALLQKLAEEDDNGKEMIAEKINISLIIKLLPDSHQQLRHAALVLLLELSKAQNGCEKIGRATGGILMLVTSKYNREMDAFASETSDRILSNLDKSPDNIKRMADIGLLEPLLNHLADGNEDMQVEMATYLGEIVIEHDKRAYVAEKASPALVRLVQSENSVARRVGFKALAQVSSYHPQSHMLSEAGIVKIMVEEMFTKRMFNDLMNSRNEAAVILANLIESGLAQQSFHVNTHGHTLMSDYFVYNIIHMIKNSSPDDLNINLIRILVSLSKSSTTMKTIVSVVKETDASFALIELINNPHEELGVAAIKLLIALSPHIGHTLSERLCKTRGLPENLLRCPTEVSHITEKYAVSAKFLAHLPHQNLTLNLALVSNSLVSKILNAIHLVERNGARTSRYSSDYLEGLVGILVRFTATLYEPQMLYLAINHNLTSVFAQLLMKTSNNEVQRLSATGLENLSSATPSLSKPAQTRSSKFMGSFNVTRSLSMGTSKKKQIKTCPIHMGICSSKSTFCLVEENAVTKLLECVQSDEAGVAEAALSAISTLLDDRVDVDKSLRMLNEMKAVEHVLNAVKEHKRESLLHKAFWVINKFLSRGGDRYVLNISQDRMLPGMLVSAFHRGDDDTKEMAGNILRRLDKMPSFSTHIS